MREGFLAYLVPVRHLVYVGVLIAGFAVVLLLGGLYLAAQRLGAHATDGMIAAFDLDHEGSIACWLSIVGYFLCGLVSLLIRKLRGTLGAEFAERQAWLAVSLLWFMMSLDEGSSLHEGFKELMTMVTGTRIMGDGSIYWVLPYFLLLSIAGLFLLVQAWRVPSAVVCLVSAGVCFAVAIAGQLDFILSGRPILETWLEESCEMLGQLFILLTLGRYARHVAGNVVARQNETLRADPGLLSRKSDDESSHSKERHQDALRRIGRSSGAVANIREPVISEDRRAAC
jgi:hypothetical protein